MTQIKDLHDELRGLPDLFDASLVIIDFISALQSGDFEKKGTQWVYDPNFVTLSIHSQRAHNITVCVRGNPHEFPEFKHVPISGALAGYSRFKIEELLDLDAALIYIRKAHELWTQGRSRIQKEVKIIER